MRVFSLLIKSLLVVLLISGCCLAVTGDTIRSIPSPSVCPQGLAYGDNHIWNVDRKTDMIYKINPINGTAVDSFQAPGYFPRGLAWDGGNLWCVDAEEQQIYSINPQTRIVERAIFCPLSRPTGLTWDGKYLWIAAGRNNELHQISAMDGTTIRSIPSPTSNSCGLTFDGKYLWVSDRYKDMIYMVSIDDGTVIVTFDAPGPHSWGLAGDGDFLWNVDYQTDEIYQLLVHDDDLFSRSEEKTQFLEFTHQVRNFGPDTIKTLDVYLAIPKNLDNQELTAKLVFDPDPIEIITDRWDQEIAHFVFQDLGPTDFTAVSMKAHVKLYKTQYYIFPEKVGSLKDIPKPIREKYLVDNTKFSITDPVIQNGVKEAVGDENNPYWIARRIFKYIIDHVEYELSGGWNVAPTVLARGNGSCSEYSFVYIAMCRSAGLPARYVGSVAIRGDDASRDDVFHRWVEVYLPGYGWIPVDPSGGDRKRPADQARYFGHLNNCFLITTTGGGGSEYLEWSYNCNEKWTSKGKCKIAVENIGEWSPLEETE
ncbi:MAG: transglutaminase domain-containing protein [candidate division Zixibacteria bacterium]|nr:transglutaminase domain-containing protein [candidate division Zixibacteria bacterium]